MGATNQAGSIVSIIPMDFTGIDLQQGVIVIYGDAGHKVIEAFLGENAVAEERVLGAFKEAMDNWEYLIRTVGIFPANLKTARTALRVLAPGLNRQTLHLG